MNTTTKYFSDSAESVEIAWPYSMKNADVAILFPGVKALRLDSFSRLVGKGADGNLYPVTRKIHYKGRPSLHECNAKCRGGKCGGVCECKCGGKNHGVSCAA